MASTALAEPVMTVPHEIIMADISLVDIPDEVRVLNKQAVKDLAGTIQSDGLLQAIGLRLNLATPGRYILVFGQHRIAAHKMLGLTAIEARVFDLTDEDAEACTAAENIFRSEVPSPMKASAFLRWAERWTAKFPKTREYVAAGIASGKARRRKAAAKAKEVALLAGEPAPADEPESKETPTDEIPYAEVAAQLLNIDPQSARRHARIARELGKENTDFLAGMSFGIKDMELLSKVQPERIQNMAVKYASIGIMSVKEAIEKAKAEIPVTVSVEGVATCEPVPPLKAPDDEWFDRECRSFADQLGDSSYYYADALMYRHMIKELETFSKLAKEVLREGKYKTRGGSFSKYAAGMVTAEHPANWLLCGPCGGKGLDHGFPCRKCHGKCFEYNHGDSNRVG